MDTKQLRQLFQLLGMPVGFHSNASFAKQDDQRVYLSIKRVSDKEKKIRQAKRKTRKEAKDAAAEKQGIFMNVVDSNSKYTLELYFS